MSEPYLGQISIVAFTYAPRGWAFCDGQLLPISLNTALFSLLGTAYGGNGVTTFALPDLREKAPVHVGGSVSLGQSGGEVTHVLNANEMAGHSHAVMATANQATGTTPGGNVLAVKPRRGKNVYAPPGAVQALDPSSVSTVAGGGQAHNNVQPLLTLNFVIALQGIFPTQS